MFSFKKEEVAPAAASPRALQSALSSGIAKQKEHSSVGSPAFQPSSSLSLVSTPQPPADSALGDGYLVSHVIKSVITKYLQTTGGGGDSSAGRLSSADSDRYYLMVADDDGHVDDDFPEIDPNVPISSVGVDKFVLCDRATENPVLRLCIPEAALDIQRIVREAGPAAELSVSVSQPLMGGRGASSVPSTFLSSVPEEGYGDDFEKDKRGGGKGGRNGFVQQGGADSGVFLHVTLKASNVPRSKPQSEAFVL